MTADLAASGALPACSGRRERLSIVGTTPVPFELRLRGGPGRSSPQLRGPRSRRAVSRRMQRGAGQVRTSVALGSIGRSCLRHVRFPDRPLQLAPALWPTSRTACGSDSQCVARSSPAPLALSGRAPREECVPRRAVWPRHEALSRAKPECAEASARPSHRYPHATGLTSGPCSLSSKTAPPQQQRQRRFRRVAPLSLQ